MAIFNTLGLFGWQVYISQGDILMLCISKIRVWYYKWSKKFKVSCRKRVCSIDYQNILYVICSLDSSIILAIIEMLLNACDKPEDIELVIGHSRSRQLLILRASHQEMLAGLRKGLQNIPNEYNRCIVKLFFNMANK